MRRREFITLLGGAAASLSPARAQEPRRVIGILTSFDFPNWLSEYGMPAFFQGLKDAGFVEGRNISIEIRQAAEKALGANFDVMKFHDFVLSQGLLPPALLRKAVLEGLR